MDLSKYTMAVIAIVVSIVVVAALLVPVIDDYKESTRETVVIDQTGYTNRMSELDGYTSLTLDYDGSAWTISSTFNGGGFAGITLETNTLVALTDAYALVYNGDGIVVYGEFAGISMNNSVWVPDEGTSIIIEDRDYYVYHTVDTEVTETVASEAGWAVQTWGLVYSPHLGEYAAFTASQLSAGVPVGFDYESYILAYGDYEPLSLAWDQDREDFEFDLIDGDTNLSSFGGSWNTGDHYATVYDLYAETEDDGELTIGWLVTPIAFAYADDPPFTLLSVVPIMVILAIAMAAIGLLGRRP